MSAAKIQQTYAPELHQTRVRTAPKARQSTLDPVPDSDGTRPGPERLVRPGARDISEPGDPSANERLVTELLVQGLLGGPPEAPSPPRPDERGRVTPVVDGPAKTASLLTLNTRALRAFETILEQARELAKADPQA